MTFSPPDATAAYTLSSSSSSSSFSSSSIPCRSFVYKTPRGKSIVAHVPSYSTYEELVATLLNQAVVADQLTITTSTHTNRSNDSSPYQSRVCNVRNSRRRGRDLARDLTFEAPSCTIHSVPQPHISCSEVAYIVYNGKIIDRTNYQTTLLTNTSTTATRNNPAPPLHIALQLRIRGGIDRQNRVGSKFGGGGVSSSQQSERERKERLRELALETVDLAKDPYLMRNHLGTYECKLCLTLHTNEANYLAHTQGKKHQAGLAKRAMMEKKAKGLRSTICPVVPDGSAGSTAARKRIKIGRPGYTIAKSRHWETNQRCLSFTLNFPEISANIQPRHRFMSAYEQKVESPPDRRYQYLLVAAEPYETVGFKVPNEPLDRKEGMFVSHWDAKEKTLTLTLYFLDSKEDGEVKEGVVM